MSVTAKRTFSRGFLLLLSILLRRSSTSWYPISARLVFRLRTIRFGW